MMEGSFKINTQPFCRAINSIIPFVEKKSPMTAITNIMIYLSTNFLELNATNLEAYISNKIPLVNENSLKTPVILLIKAHLIHEVSKKLFGTEINFLIRENLLTIEDNKGKFDLVTSTEKFPLRKIENYNFLGYISINILEKLLKYTSIKIEKQFRVFLSSFQGKLQLILHDNRRMSFSELLNPMELLDFSANFLLKNLEDLIKFFNLNSDNSTIELLQFGQDFLFRSSDQNKNIFLRTGAQKPINPQTWLNDLNITPKFILEVSLLKTALTRALIVSSLITHTIRLIFEENYLEVKSFDPNTGGSFSSIRGSGGGMKTEILVNGDYLLEAVNLINEDYCEIFYSKDQITIKSKWSTHIMIPQNFK